MKKNKTFAIQIASSISIKNCKSSLKGNLLFYDSDELFYEIGEDQYVYIFKYGVLCFYNFDEASKEEFTKKILTYSKNIYENQHWEEVKIIIGGKTNKMTPDLIEISKFNIDSLRLIMLNVSQSVALDKYTEITEEILEDTNQHTLFLEEKGKLNIGGNKLKKFIGKILNIKNKLSENLYIFDSHDITWGDEILNKLDQDLKATFDLKDRSKSIEYQLGIIKENLELFKDIMFHRESSILEWVIIILILVEVVDMFILRFL